VGSGVFAMGDAFHHAGIVVAPVLTLLLAAACVHSQHILVTYLLYFDQKLFCKKNGTKNRKSNEEKI
jgi:amino acid permease